MDDGTVIDVTAITPGQEMDAKVLLGTYSNILYANTFFILFFHYKMKFQ